MFVLIGVENKFREEREEFHDVVWVRSVWGKIPPWLREHSKLTFVELFRFRVCVNFDISLFTLFRLLAAPVDRRSIAAATLPASLTVSTVSSRSLIVKVFLVVAVARLNVMRWISTELCGAVCVMIAENLWIFLRCHRFLAVRCVRSVDFHISAVCLCLVCFRFRARGRVKGRKRNSWKKENKEKLL